MDLDASKQEKGSLIAFQFATLTSQMRAGGLSS
jgi:hypothetical protein